MVDTLKKSLQFRHLVFFGLMAMNPMAGMSMFGFSSFRSQGNPMLSYLIAFIAISFTALSYSKMVKLFPSAGSSYTFAGKGIHPLAGFFAGWVMLLDYVLIPASCLLQVGLYLNVLVPAIPFWIWVVLVSTLVVLANCFGVEVAARFNMIMLGYLLFSIVAFLAAVIYYIATQDTLTFFNTQAIFDKSTFGLSPVISGAALAIMCYFGFESMTTLSEETQGTSKQFSKAVFLSLGILTIIFLITTYAAKLIMPDYKSIQNMDTAITEVIVLVGGPTLNMIILVGMICSFIGISLAAQSSASRILYAQGRDGVLPRKFFGYLNPTRKTPTKAIIFMGVVSLIIPLLVPLLLLTELSSFGGLCGFILVNLALIVYSLRTGVRSKWFIHYIFPAAGLLVTTYILLGLGADAKIVGLSWILIGTVVLTLTTRTKIAKTTVSNGLTETQSP
ncbi:APC family permease [Paenibacillus jamilae]|uniref:APC family permease n=1 Tax=Paenibacillus jamilae TaxID=114136 RepID=UPI003D26C51C